VRTSLLLEPRTMRIHAHCARSEPNVLQRRARESLTVAFVSMFLPATGDSADYPSA
jgi:hypothetical protein